MEEFGRELGVTTKGIYRGWELGKHEPQRGIDELAECLARAAGIRKAKIAPRALALWVYSGDDPMPDASGPVLKGLRSARDAVLKAVQDKLVSVEDASAFFRVAEKLRGQDLGSDASYLLQWQRAG